MGYIKKKDEKEISEPTVQSSPTNPQEPKPDQDIISLVDIIDEEMRCVIFFLLINFYL